MIQTESTLQKLNQNGYRPSKELPQVTEIESKWDSAGFRVTRRISILSTQRSTSSGSSFSHLKTAYLRERRAPDPEDHGSWLSPASLPSENLFVFFSLGPERPGPERPSFSDSASRPRLPAPLPSAAWSAPTGSRAWPSLPSLPPLAKLRGFASRAPHNPPGYPTAWPPRPPPHRPPHAPLGLAISTAAASWSKPVAMSLMVASVYLDAPGPRLQRELGPLAKASRETDRTRPGPRRSRTTRGRASRGTRDMIRRRAGAGRGEARRDERAQPWRAGLLETVVTRRRLRPDACR